MFKRVFKQVSIGVALSASVFAVHAADITGAGASFPYPIYAKWASDYKAATGNSVNYQSIGSGGGQQQIKAKTVDFGASDDPLKAEDLEQNGLLQFPAVIGGTVAVVNIDGVTRASSSCPARSWPTSTWARSRSGMMPPSRH
ncbi:PBP superfamily domain protein [Bordetella holmesii ATCC 51541]|nr:PBP superfamily domain protein [Bordetella holmesii ATCC 51541]